MDLKNLGAKNNFGPKRIFGLNNFVDFQNIFDPKIVFQQDRDRVQLITENERKMLDLMSIA